MKSNESRAKELIERMLYMNIATITPDGKPWNTPLIFAYDTNFRFYWLSWKNNQHSINVKHNPYVFATIYDSTVPTDKGYGVYLQGQAQELNHLKDIVIGIRHLYGRRNKMKRPLKEFIKRFPRRIYKFTPQKVWINDSGELDGNYIDVRVKLDTDKLKEVMREK